MLLKWLRLPITVRIVIIVVPAMVCMSYFQLRPASIREQVDNYYQVQIKLLRKELVNFEHSSHSNKSRKILQHSFSSSRLAYKKMALITEYFNVYESKFLNGPALKRVEEGTPDIIIEPQGFQAIEEALFTQAGTVDHSALSQQLQKMLKLLDRLEKEIDRPLKFSEESVWDAIRASLVRITALGITGFDSPIALHSLPEAVASLDAIRSVLTIFATSLDAKQPGISTQLLALLDKSKAYVTDHKNFDRFDRLHFIAHYIEPLYKQLSLARQTCGIGVPPGRNAVNLEARSIFQKDFFDINFFSPGKEYWVNLSRAELGKQLFSDPILSGSKKRSCASCHLPGKAFTDGMKRPLSADNSTELARNTPTLWNSALQTRQFFDTRTDILENQLKEVVHNTDEMKGSLLQSVVELKNSPLYLKRFQESYPNEKESINAFNIANAISSYIRTLISLNSRFDQYMAGDRSKLNLSEKRGFNLFTGKAKCATCHFIPLFNGLVPPEFSETETEVLGVPNGKEKTNAMLDTDHGKYEISKAVIHKFSFKTPTLRNIELTAPYMHNGVFDTLEEVMEFYNHGGGEGLKIAPENQTLPKDKLNLNKKEITDIIAFLRSLTDQAAAKYNQ